MTNRNLTDLVVEASLLIAEIDQHPEYQDIKKEGYEADAEIADAYQSMVDLNCEISKREQQ